MSTSYSTAIVKYIYISFFCETEMLNLWEYFIYFLWRTGQDMTGITIETKVVDQIKTLQMLPLLALESFSVCPASRVDHFH